MPTIQGRRKQEQSIHRFSFIAWPSNFTGPQQICVYAGVTCEADSFFLTLLREQALRL